MVKKKIRRSAEGGIAWIQRVPGLLFNSPDKSLKSINCTAYEILGFEPPHDIGKHIENLSIELPDYL